MRIRRKLLSLLCGCNLLVFSLTQAPPSEAASPLQKIVIVFGGFNERSGFLFVAKDMRFFEEYGLDAQIVQVRSGPIAISAMATGDAQFYTASATGSVLGAMASGLDLVFIAGILNKLDGDFDVSPKIKSPEELRGKVLGVQSMGGGIWMFTMLALDHWGLVPERDKIQFRVLGDQSVIAQGLMTGAVDGAYLGYSFSKVVQRQGFRVLADLAKAKISYQGVGVVARKSFLRQSPEVAEKTLKALGKAIVFFQDPANKQRVVEILAKWLRLSHIEDAEEGYDMIKGLYNSRLYPTIEGLRNTQRVLTRVDPKYARLKVEELSDERIVRKLEMEGFLK